MAFRGILDDIITKEIMETSMNNQLNERKALGAIATASALALGVGTTPTKASSITTDLKSAAGHVGQAAGDLLSATGKAIITGAELAAPIALKGAKAGAEYVVDNAPKAYAATKKTLSQALVELEKIDTTEVIPKDKPINIQRYIDELIVMRGPEIIKLGKVSTDFITTYGSEGVTLALAAAISTGAKASDRYEEFSPKAKEAFDKAISSIKKVGIAQYKKSKDRLDESVNSLLSKAIINIL